MWASRTSRSGESGTEDEGESLTFFAFFFPPSLFLGGFGGLGVLGGLGSLAPFGGFVSLGGLGGFRGLGNFSVLGVFFFITFSTGGGVSGTGDGGSSFSMIFSIILFPSGIVLALMSVLLLFDAF